MRSKILCTVCGCDLWIRGSYDPSVNATKLDDNDKAWNDGCEHIKAGDWEFDPQGEVDYDDIEDY